jgi:phospholipid/cholesterol/gamma-HCH transport system substrate-binding protein
MRSDFTKVGLMILIGAVLTVFGYNFLRAQMTTRGHYELKVHFEDIRNLTQGARVLMAGVPIGFVSKTRLLTGIPLKAEVVLAIREEVKIPEGSQFRIPSGALFPTDSRIEVIPPTTSAGVISPGSTLEGVSAAGFDRLMPEFEKASRSLNELLVATRKLIEDNQLREGIQSMLESATKTTDSAGELMTTANESLKENRAAVRQLLAQASGATQEFRKALKQVNNLLSDPRPKEDLIATLDSARQAIQRVDEILQDVQKLTSDSEMQKNVKETAANVRTLTEKFNTIADKTSGLVDNATDLTKELTHVAADSRDIVQTAKTTFEKVNKTLDASLSLRTLGFSEPQYRLSFGADIDTDRYRTDATVYLPLKDDRLLLIGVYDLSENDQMIFQYGTKVSPKIELRYGIYAAKPGFGVDYMLSNHLQATLDMFNPNDVNTNLRLQYRFSGNIYAWFGVEKLFRDNHPVLGIQIQR